MKNRYFLFLLLFSFSFNIQAQVASDFKQKVKHKIGLPTDFIKARECLTFSTPSLMPSPLKFSIGDFKPYLLESSVLENNISTSEKLLIKPLSAVFSSIINGKNISRYRSGSISNAGMQHYGINFFLIGYGKKMSIQAEAFRTFSATISKTGFAENNDEVEKQAAEILKDSVFLVGIIKMPDSTQWILEFDYKKDKNGHSLSGMIYNNSETYLIHEQNLDESGNSLNFHLNYPGMILSKNNNIVCATEFPFGYGAKGALLFSKELPLPERLVFSATSALVFSYWRSVINN